ncbi:HAD-IB family phosphatase [Marinobacter sp. NFXS9]|uniref:HAD-IB family phosphatase n=1 Tax=Marinobacter sp. NFXS9 TaxID=2818433 RepID=UPI0032DEB0A5
MSTGFFFDLDGTVTTTELLPCIASELAATDEIATLTKLTMDGHIPFADSMRLRCLILGQIPLEQVHSVVSSVPLDPLIVDFITNRPKECAIVTGNLDIWLTPLMERLRCRWYTSQAAFDSRRLGLTHILDKGQVIRGVKSSGEFMRHVAVGDGANDASMLEHADIGIAYGGVHSPAPVSVEVSKILVNSSESLCSLLKAL